MPHYVLTLSCPDRPGIVNAVTGHLLRFEGNILEAQQYNDRETDRFFMRTVFALAPESLPQVREAFGALARAFRMEWSLRDRNEPRRVMLLASKFDHCLADVLYRWRIDELPMAITAVVANHPRDTYRHLDFDGIPFHHLPVEKGRKHEQEAQLASLIENTGTELVVLARYMQVLSSELARTLAGRCINIHHSFLPGFKGARPYEQAHARGVKLIGATAHFATTDLDEGPIIEQALERVDHAFSPEQLLRTGRDVECLALGRALRYVLEHRVFINGLRTVVLR